MKQKRDMLWMFNVVCCMTFLFLLVRADYQARPCLEKKTVWGSVVCICNSTYCDSIEPNSYLPEKQFAVYTSSEAGLRLSKRVSPMEEHVNSTVEIRVERETEYQTILGFGGAFTDAAGINIADLSTPAAEKLLESYFHEDGIQYTIGRIPMASCDFSSRLYSYNDFAGDLQMTHFQLQQEDYKYKIPFIQQALNMSKRPILLFGSPWSSPAWMKTNHKMTGKGTLLGSPRGKYYKAWALYFVRFIEEYAKHHISIWGVTAQNEPTTGLLSNFSYQALGFTAELQRDFIAYDLGPMLEKYNLSQIKIMVLDDTRVFLPGWAKIVMSSAEAAKYVSGIAVHWYADFIVPPLPLLTTHEAFPDKFILATEACSGSNIIGKRIPVKLGSWDRFESYTNDIMDDLENWVVGWTDWNIALNMEGGPNWVSNFVDSPIIVNKAKDEFYKQPMFYAMGHFSKFLPQSKRVGLKIKGNSTLRVLAFLSQDGSTVVMISNRSDRPQYYAIVDIGIINGVAPPRSLQTVIWWPK